MKRQSSSSKSVALDPSNYSTITTSMVDAGVMEKLLKELQLNVSHSMGIPSSMQSPYYSPLSSSTFSIPEPTTVDKYPITHTAYKLINRGPSTTKYFLRSVVGMTSCANEIESLAETIEAGGKEVYAAPLRKARVHLSLIPLDEQKNLHESVEDGHVYDPWFRCISKLATEKYKVIAASKIDNIRTLSNSREIFFYCIFDTTIDGESIRLFIYEFISAEYVNKQKFEKHIKAISPFVKMVNPEYDLKFIS